MNLRLFLCGIVLITARLGNAQNYVAEVLFVVDDEVVQRYQRELAGGRALAEEELRKDIDYIITETNKLLQTLQGLNFQVAVRSLNILDRNIFTSGFATPSILICSEALPAARDWLTAQGSYDELNYDAAIVWTGFDLYGYSSLYARGFSYNGGGCDSSLSLAVVEFNATYATAVATAKNIVRIFGGSESGVAYEDAGQRYNYPADSDRWSFNPCASTDIQAFINKLSPNCLVTTSPESTTPDVAYDSYSGRMFDADVICQRSLNDSRSYMGKLGHFFGDPPQQAGGDNVCQGIFCWMPGTEDYLMVFTPEGLVCAENQRCDNGVCGSGVPFSDSCVFGDQKELYFPSDNFQGTCQELVDQFGLRQCYNERLSAACCETCVPLYPDDENCLFGDRSSQCVNYDRSAVCPVYGDDQCCGYCQNFKRKRSVATPLSDHINITVDIFSETSFHVVKERVYDIED